MFALRTAMIFIGFSLFTFACAQGPEGAASTTSAVSENGNDDSDTTRGPASYADLKAAADDAVETFQNGGADGCTFAATEKNGSLELTIAKGGRAAPATLTFAPSDAITLRQNLDRDGSFVKAFTVGDSTLEVLHLDDAYDSVTIELPTGNATCEINY